MRTERLDPLTRLAVRFGSDKFGAHLYTPIYHQLFDRLREQPVRLLEIGVGGYDSPRAGASSLRMWSEYFPFGQIVGLDLFAKDIPTSPRVHIVQGSQTDPVLLQQIVDQYGPFDIVIDDGSHIVDHVLTTFRYLYPGLPADGIYAVEDTLTAFQRNAGGNPSGRDTIFSLAHKISLAMHRLEGCDCAPFGTEIVSLADITSKIGFYRNLITFERGDNLYPSVIGFSLQDPLVQGIYAAISAEAGNSPASRSSLSRIGMAIWSNRSEHAVALALDAARAYPDDASLLAELVHMMEWANQPEAVETLRAQAERLQTQGRQS